MAEPSEITIAANWGHLVIAYELATVIGKCKDDSLLLKQHVQNVSAFRKRLFDLFFEHTRAIIAMVINHMM